MNDQLLGVVLCGGKSSRMGRDKSLLPHPDGERFIDHAIRQLNSICADVCVAGQADSSPVAIDNLFLSDNVSFAGPITGIVNALRHASEKQFAACLVTPVDMPWLTDVDLNRLKESWLAQRQLVCAVSETNKRQPLVAIYPIETLPLLTAQAQSNDRSLNRWINTQEHQTVLLSDDACRNVNRPDDL